MTPVAAAGSSLLWGLRQNGDTYNSVGCYPAFIVPAVFLKSDISLDGSGTIDDPYIIK